MIRFAIKTIKELLYWVVGKARNPRNCVTFSNDSTLIKKHALGRIEYKQYDRKRSVSVQKAMREKDLEDIKKVI